jgi:hypothetical protein
MDASAHLRKLGGQTIHTIARGRRNRILEIRDTDVIVATDKSPGGELVAIADVQARDMLEREGEVRIDVNTVGYRSAFIGAVQAMLPGGSGVHSAPARQTRAPFSDLGIVED